MFDGETSRWIIPRSLPLLVGEAVRVGERAAGLAADVGDHLGARRSHRLPDRAHRLGEIVAADVLHRDEVLALDGAELEDVDDVRVGEARRQLRLLDEHLDEGRVVGEMRQDPLDDERPLEPGGPLDAPLVDLGHPTAADELEERVLAELNRLGELGCHDRPADRSHAPGGRRARLPGAAYDSDPVALPQIDSVRKWRRAGLVVRPSRRGRSGRRRRPFARRRDRRGPSARRAPRSDRRHEQGDAVHRVEPRAPERGPGGAGRRRRDPAPGGGQDRDGGRARRRRRRCSRPSADYAAAPSSSTRSWRPRAGARSGRVRRASSCRCSGGRRS